MTDVQFDRLIDAITRLTEKLDEVRVELNAIDEKLDTSNDLWFEMTYRRNSYEGDEARVLRVEMPR